MIFDLVEIKAEHVDDYWRSDTGKRSTYFFHLDIDYFE
jgi:hypothetical protein